MASQRRNLVILPSWQLLSISLFLSDWSHVQLMVAVIEAGGNDLWHRHHAPIGSISNPFLYHLMSINMDMAQTCDTSRGPTKPVAFTIWGWSHMEKQDPNHLWSTIKYEDPDTHKVHHLKMVKYGHRSNIQPSIFILLTYAQRPACMMASSKAGRATCKCCCSLPLLLEKQPKNEGRTV